MSPATEAPARRGRSRRFVRVALKGAVLAAGTVIVFSGAMTALAWQALGTGADGVRSARMEASPNYRDGKFRNPEPLWNDYPGMIVGMINGSDRQTPRAGIPVEAVDPARFDAPPRTGLRATWLGHSTVLLEIDGFRVLTDPVWGPRASPYSWIGPARWYPPPLNLSDLPALDAIVVSHDHYDHLDYPTVQRLRNLDVPWLVPLGVGSHLEYWGVPGDRIVELDWGESHDMTRTDRSLEIHATEARHASGRTPWTFDETLWSGYAFLGPEHRAFFSGDTGLFPRMKEIGDRLGPFDLTMIEVGAYSPAWPDWHIGPEQAVEAHGWLRGDVLLPIHWGLFDLADHAWTAPMERTVVAAQAAGAILIAPRPGGSVEPGLAYDAAMTNGVSPVERWWPAVPWRGAAEQPIISTQVDGRR